MNSQEPFRSTHWNLVVGHFRSCGRIKLFNKKIRPLCTKQENYLVEITGCRNLILSACFSGKVDIQAKFSYWSMAKTYREMHSNCQDFWSTENYCMCGLTTCEYLNWKISKFIRFLLQESLALILSRHLCILQGWKNEGRRLISFWQ